MAANTSKENHHRVVIVGGGTAGISVAARLMRSVGDVDIAVIEPSSRHFYQPLWSLVGAGVCSKEETVADESTLIPTGVTWIQEKVIQVSAEEKSLRLSSGLSISYDYLVMAAGIQLDWHKVKGLPETVGKNGVCSNYSYDLVDTTWQNMSHLTRGTAIFTYPNSPVKCGGAPQKIAYLADDQFRIRGVRENIRMVFASANPGIFSVPKYARTLNEVVARKGIETWFRTDLIAIDGNAKMATFKNLDTQEISTVGYDMIHVTPPMSCPDFLKNSSLVDSTGWVEVDKATLQHKRFPEVFSLGDCSNLPTSKTGAAIRKQAPVLVANLVSYMRALPLVATYDGYTSCPLITGYGSLVLAEFDYDLNPQETFPFDQSEERYTMYVLKKDILPQLYWRGMMKGLL